MPSKSREEDERLVSQVTKRHGGQLVEAISPEELVLMNQPECTHEKMIRDESETDFIAFVCANPKCGVVALYQK